MELLKDLTEQVNHVFEELLCIFELWLKAIALNLFIFRLLGKLVKCLCFFMSNTAIDCGSKKAWSESLLVTDHCLFSRNISGATTFHT